MPAEIARAPAIMTTPFGSKIKVHSCCSNDRVFTLCLSIQWHVWHAGREGGGYYRMHPPNDGDGPARLISASSALIGPTHAFLLTGKTYDAQADVINTDFIRNMTATQTPTAKTRWECPYICYRKKIKKIECIIALFGQLEFHIRL